MSYVKINGWAWLDEEWIKNESDPGVERRRYVYEEKGSYLVASAWRFSSPNSPLTYKVQGKKFTSEEKLESFMSTAWRWKKGVSGGEAN